MEIQARQLAQFAYYLFLLGDHKTAIPVLERILQLTPNDLESKLNLAVCCRRTGNALRAIQIYNELALQTPEDFKIWDGLAACLYQTGREAAASIAGTKSLALKDSMSKLTNLRWRLPQQTPQQYAADKKKVIAFSLFGAIPRYLCGALHNVVMAADVYPGWVCRFYIDSTVPTEFVAAAKKSGAEFVIRPDHQSMADKLGWRFAVSNDPDVGYFLVRDADSVINLREKQAVDAWLASGRYFHVMRDWWTHTELMLAGMWAGVAGVLPSMAGLQKNYRSKVMETPSADQIFLRDMVWPFVRQSVWVHDRCFTALDAHAFPGPVPSGSTHIGQDEFVVRRLEQAAFLATRVGRLGCLQLDDSDQVSAQPIPKPTTAVSVSTKNAPGN